MVSGAILTACDPKQEVIYTGTANPHFDGTMMDYLRSDAYNWALTVKAIEYAGLTDLFEGQVDTARAITFWGPKSYSIQRYLWDQGKEVVTDIPASQMRALILRHVVIGKFLKEDIAFRNMSYLITDPRQDGGTLFTCIAGNRVKAYKNTSSYEGVPEAGPVTLHLHSMTLDQMVPMATPDIQPRNGVVHALDYGYRFGNI